MNIEIVLSEIFLEEKYHRNGTECFLDPHRKKLIQITPEEIVRQKIVRYFNQHLGVPKHLILTEQHLKHYSGTCNGRMDIVIEKVVENGTCVLGIIECKSANIPLTAQVFNQVANYADDVYAEFVFTTNGIEIDGWRYNTETKEYEFLKTIPTYEEMLNSEYDKSEDVEFCIERIGISKLQDVDYLKKNDDFAFIGEDTPDDLIPSIVNLSECLLDTSHKFPTRDFGDFKTIEDIGVRYLGYKDASGSDFGTGYYRTLLIEDGDQNNQLISFCVSGVERTKDDPKFGNRTGKSVLVVTLDNFEKDYMIVQIDFNRCMHVDQNIATINHNGNVMMKLAKNSDLKQLIIEKHENMIRNNQIHLGELNNKEFLYMDTPCVVDFIVNLIRYAFIRDKYKQTLSQRKKNENKEVKNIINEEVNMEKSKSSQEQSRPKRGADLKIKIDLDFYEAVYGVTKVIKIKRTETCSMCNGSNRDMCDSCQGSGIEEKERTITINIPAGVDNGSILPLREQGNAGAIHGENGDLLVYLTVEESSVFKRNEDDVYYELPISYAQALLGDNVIVPTLEGKINLKIPEGTGMGKVFRLKEKGIPNVNGDGRGDQFITIKIELPAKINSEQRSILEQFEESLGLDCYPEAKQFLERTEAEYKKQPSYIEESEKMK